MVQIEDALSPPIASSHVVFSRNSGACKHLAHVRPASDALLGARLSVAANR
jgi:hypothetical protein